MTQPAFKIVIDDFAGVVVTEPTDRRPRVMRLSPGIRANDNAPLPRQLCACLHIDSLARAGVLVALLRCPVHG